MSLSTRLSPREQFTLIGIATAGGLGLNGVFLYVVFLRSDLLERALSDPIAWALMIEALLVAGMLAWLFARRAMSRLGPVLFFVLSLAGGLAFSIPVALLVEPREGRRDP
jgi:hypothetical protein